MEAALVSAATGALKPVLGKLATLVDYDYKLFKGVPDEISSLTRELAAMDAFLLKMSEEEDLDVQDKAWMTEVRELSYDMEDSVDDFKKLVDSKDTKADGFVEKIKHLLAKMKVRRQIGNVVEDMRKQIIEVGERNERYMARQAFSSTRSATIDNRALAIFEHVSKLVGIDEPKAEIINLLMEKDGCASTQQQEMALVSIVGSAGMGKTTLANQVYQEIKGKFECRAFLSVLRNPDVMNILRTILSEVGGIKYADTEAGSIQQLIGKIKDFLVDKRYFVVVDDIWDVDTWDIIKHALPMTSSGSIIITTTRMNNVAHSCSSSFNGHIYNIRPLDMVHSRQLFDRRLFNREEDCPSHLQEVSNQILKRCVGLPLAIIAISGLLANKERTENIWKEVKDSIGQALERNHSVKGMMNILSLSYFDLPPRLKTCFLYMSIFPEDYIIEKKYLIRRWIAEGFIQTDGRYTLKELGRRCFHELLERSLIQPVEINKYGKVKTCRVHDVVLDFIISKSIEDNFVTFVGVPILSIGRQLKVRRLSLQVCRQSNSIVPNVGLIFSHVRSLNVFGDSIGIPCLDQFRYLRVLDFGGRHQLENVHLENIGRLSELRYLNLRWATGVCELPKQIGHLRCLEMLDLRYTRLGELPSSIVDLGRLVHLLTDNGVKFPDAIAKMQALETLKRVGVLKQSVNFLQELGQLRNLRSLDLDFSGDSSVGIFEDTTGVKEECKKALASSLHSLGTQNLGCLTIFSRTNFLNHSPVCPIPVSLRKLVICDSTVPCVTNWVGTLINLQKLRLRVEGIGQEDLCVLGSLPALLTLDLIGTTMSRDRLSVRGEAGFRCLKHFCYDMTFHGMDLMFAAGGMPRLETLVIIFDSDKTESLSVLALLLSISESKTSRVSLLSHVEYMPT
uniref:Uncharacterized protein n=1 Tax=Avena sativa TaxID=4498 RepID=A0ACD5WJT2_AVESA